MSGKSTACYSHVFEYIEKNVMSLECVSYITDYEKAMRRALNKLHPEVKRFACYFHYCQAVKKRAYKTNGLSKLIFSNAAARLVYFRIMCLPLLPHHKITEMFAALKTEAYELNKTVFRPFIRYWERQWLQNVSFVIFHGHMLTNCCVFFNANKMLMSMYWLHFYLKTNKN